MKPWRFALFALLAAVFWTVSAPDLTLAAVCSNGSGTDCNPEGSTFITSSAFVDPAPPAGFVQCAGFVNTPGDDVGWDWDQNCLDLKARFEADNPGEDLDLFFRLFDDDTGALLAGGRLTMPSVLDLAFLFPTALNYETADLEGDGLLTTAPLNPGVISAGGVTVFWDEQDPVAGSTTAGRTCGVLEGATFVQWHFTDIAAASEDDAMLLHVGATSPEPGREAVYGPGSKSILQLHRGGCHPAPGGALREGGRARGIYRDVRHQARG